MLFLVLSKKVGVSTSIGHQQYQFSVVLTPNEKPIWSNVTLPIAFVLTVKNVRMVFLWQTTFCSKDVENICQQLLIVTPFEATV